MPQYRSSRRAPIHGRFTTIAGSLLFSIIILFSSVHPAFALRGVAVAFLPDATASMDIREAASAEKAGDYQLYIPSFMAFSRLPENFNGAIWFRITLGPSFEKPVGDLHVDFGSAMPGITRIYIPQGDGFTALEASPPSAAFTISASEKLPDTFYARLDGTPGLWFRPMLTGAEAEEGKLPPAHILLAGLFGTAMLLLLLQYARGTEEWRLWGAITAGCGIVAAILPSTPAAGFAYTPLMAAAMLMPGLIIVFFAHTARHLFNGPKNLAGYDTLLALYYGIGAAIALLPLIPGFLHICRYLPLAFVVLLPLLFVAVVALGRSLKGAWAFFCACLLTIGGVVLSAWELTASGAPFISGLGGLAGLGIGLVFLGLTSPAKARESTAEEEDVFDSLHRACQPERRENQPLAITPWSEPEEGAPEQRDPDRETIPAEENASAALSENPSSHEPVFTPEQTVSEPPKEPFAPQSSSVDAGHVPENETAPSAPAAEITLLKDLLEEESPAAEQVSYSPSMAEELSKTLFDLPMLVKDAYDAISPLAEKKNLGMSWFIAPQTGRLFEGNKILLDSALRMLLRDMAEAIDRGNVRLNVRRYPDSKEAGHIVFTFTEWDARQTFYARNMAGLSEAWALAEQTGGVFSVEHSPTSGTTVIFSSVFTPMDAPKVAGETPRASMTPSGPEYDTVAAEPVPVTQKPTAPLGQNSTTPQAREQTPWETQQKFTDYPDIALPGGFEIVSATSVPAGLNGEDLVEEAAAERAPSRVIVADITASGRTRMRAAFADSPYSILEGTSPQTAPTLYKRNPSALVVMSADMPEADIEAAIQAMHAEDALMGRAPVPVLALVNHEAQAERMIRIGCAKTLTKPLDNATLLAAALELAPLAGRSQAEPKTDMRRTPPAPEETLETIPVPAEALEPAMPPDVSGDSGPGFPALPEEAPVRIVDETISGTAPGPSPESVLDAALSNIPEESASAENAPSAEAAQRGIFAGVLPEDRKEAPHGAEEAEKKNAGRGLDLIDMIITDEDEESGDAKPGDAKPGEPEEAPRLPEEKTEPPTEAARLVPEAAKSSLPLIKATVRSQKLGKKIKPSSLSDPEASLDDTAPPTSLIIDDANPARDDSTPSSGISVQLPGEEDSIFKDMIPLIPGLIHELADAMNDAAKGREEKSPLLVQEAAERVAGKAETFGLARLERIARCVERAAAADDIEPMECVLDDLVNWVERYKESLARLHREHEW